MKYISNKLIILLLLLPACLLAATPRLEVHVKNNQVSVNSTFKLYIDLYESNANAPDLAEISKDFTIVMQISGMSTSYINGVKNSKKTWELTLKPKQTGIYNIPALTTGNLSSQPLLIEVLAKTNTNDNNPLVALTMTAEDLKPYIQAMTKVKVQLTYDTTFTDLSLTDPSATDAKVILLQEDNSIITQANGKQARVLTREYGIFAQSSGQVTLQSPEFQGIYFAQDDNLNMGFNNLFIGGLTAQERVIEHTEDLIFNVQPALVNSDTTYWLAASDLKVIVNKDFPLTAAVGQPISKQITLVANNCLAEQIPDLVNFTIEQVTFYKDNPIFTNEQQQANLIGKRVENITLMPNAVGQLEVPEVQIKWWDVVKQEFNTTIIPGNKITINPALPTVNSIDNITNVGGEELKSEVAYWRQLAILLLCLWVVVLILVIGYKYKRKLALLMNSLHTPAARRKYQYTKLQLACSQNNNKEIEKLLLELVSAQIGEGVVSLTAAAKYCSKELAIEILHLEQSIYSNTGMKYDASVLWQLLSQEKFILQKQHVVSKDDLPPLNPTA